MNKVKIFCNSINDIGFVFQKCSDYHIKINEHNFYPSTNKYYNELKRISLYYNDFILFNKQTFINFLKTNTI